MLELEELKEKEQKIKKRISKKKIEQTKLKTYFLILILNIFFSGFNSLFSVNSFNNILIK